LCVVGVLCRHDVWDPQEIRQFLKNDCISGFFLG